MAASSSSNRHAKEGMLSQWQSDPEALKRRCREIWELYMYFVFLDVKGDRALLRLTARQLQSILEISPKTLAANLLATGPWAVPALQSIAQGAGRNLLEKRHSQALNEWYAALKAAMVKACETAVKGAGVRGSKLEELKLELHRQQALQFWNHYFQTSAKVGWWDFADAFQECFCGSSCPSDILERLREHVAKPCSHRVSLHSWEYFMEKHGPGAPQMLSHLMEEVLQNLSSTVYRPTVRSASAGSSPVSGEVDDSCQEDLALFLARHSLSPTKSEGSRKSSTKEKPSSRSAARGDDDAATKAAPSVTAAGGAPGVLVVPTPQDPRRPMDLEAARAAAAAETPQDPRLRTAPVEPGEQISWGDFEAKLQTATKPWWATMDPNFQANACEESIHVQAIRAVNSSLSATRKALILRVASGTMGSARPRIQRGDDAQMPAIFITPNDTSCSRTTKFGRGRAEGSRMLQPHVVMTEPIASRSHFSVVYDDARGKYQVMDAGSKWGTFKKITTKGRPVSCGDWVRIGNAELLVRFCGGGCNRHRHHANHRMHGLGVARKVFGSSGCSTLPASSETHTPWRRQWTEDQDQTPTDEQIAEKALGMILGGSSRFYGSTRKNWSSSFERLCRDVNPMGGASLRPAPEKSQEEARPSEIALPASMLEIDFISGPRIGERVMVTDRICTIGRGDTCTIQLSDPTLANVSRVHCSFRNVRGRWWLCDEGSTNGTWSRLSCALDPSAPQDIEPGEILLAGVQELKVEEAELSRWCIPSPASSILAELCSSERR